MTTLSRTVGAAGSVTLTTKNTAGQLITPVSAPTVSWYTDAGRTTGALALAVTGAGSAYTASWTGPQAPAVPGTRYLKVTIETSAAVFSVDADDDISFVAAGADFSTGLCTLAEVKAQLGKTTSADDTELQAHIDATTAVVEALCGPVLPAVVTDEYHCPRGDVIVLRSERVASITSLSSYQGVTPQPYTQVSNPSTAGPYTYTIDARTSILRRVGTGGYPQPWDAGGVYVTYVAGFATIPAGINLAARIIVQHLWRLQNGGAGLPGLTDDELVDVQGFGFAIPKRALEILDRWRRIPGIA